ncbi:hypothetical protein, partial [Streptomyces tricolor]
MSSAERGAGGAAYTITAGPEREGCGDDRWTRPDCPTGQTTVPCRTGFPRRRRRGCAAARSAREVATLGTVSGAHLVAPTAAGARTEAGMDDPGCSATARGP